MVVTISSATFSGKPEFRTGKRASYIDTTTGFLAANHYMAAHSALTHVLPAATYTSMGEWSPYRVWPAGYELRTAYEARGGCFPYVWSLSNEPSGMVIGEVWSEAAKATHGVLQWTTPVAGTHNFSVRCTDQAGSTISWTCRLVVHPSGDALESAMFSFISPSNSADGTRNGTRAKPWINLTEAYMDEITPASVLYSDVVTKKWMVISEAGTYAAPDPTDASVWAMGTNKQRVIFGSYAVAQPIVTMTTSPLAWNQDTTADVAMINVNTDGDTGLTATDAFHINTREAYPRLLMQDLLSTNYNDAGTAGAGANGMVYGPATIGLTGPAERNFLVYRNVNIDVSACTDSRAFTFGGFGLFDAVFHNCNVLNGNANAGAGGGHIYPKWYAYRVTWRLCDLPNMAGNVVLAEPGTGLSGWTYNQDDLQWEFCKLGRRANTEEAFSFGQGGGSPTNKLVNGRVGRCNIIGTIAQLAVAEGTLTHVGNVIQNSGSTGFPGGTGWTNTPGTGAQADQTGTSKFTSFTDLSQTATPDGIVGAEIL